MTAYAKPRHKKKSDLPDKIITAIANFIASIAIIATLTWRWYKIQWPYLLIFLNTFLMLKLLNQ